MNIKILEGIPAAEEPLNVKSLLPLPVKNKYGNLSVKWIEVTSRISFINELIIEVHQVYHQFHNPLLSHKIVYRYKFIIEQIFYWLRKTLDELILLLQLMEGLAKDQQLQALFEKPIKDIKKSNSLYPLFKPFDTLLDDLTNISNAYKHSFINSDLTGLYHEEKLMVFALKMHNNDLKKEPKLYELFLSDILTQYDDLIKSIKEKIIEFNNILQAKK